MLRKTLTAAAFTLVAATSLMAIPTAASADVYCGDGYKVVHQSEMHNYTKVWGTVYLTYNSSTGKNCVTVVKSNYVGTSTWTNVTLTVQGGSSYGVSETVKYYGGPVYASAKGACVKYSAVIEAPSGARAIGGRSTWGNCG
ncbi:spore-associated protein A [Nonomuraea sp. NPDC003560]|uniref:spore-associated protein A n=1 Tax=unclassified Nonomuraea TaxID=2593643 RepID=UPI0036B350D7